MALLPDQACLDWCYGLPEWWNFLHILNQATVILLLDISIGPVPTRLNEEAVPAEPIEVVLNGVKKGLSWLHCLGKTSEAARRASEFGHDCIRRIATTKDLDLSGLPSPVVPFRNVLGTNAIVSQDAIEAVSAPGCSKPAVSPRSSCADESFHVHPQKMQFPPKGIRDASPVFDADSDMSRFILHANDAEIEELLLSMTGFNE